MPTHYDILGIEPHARNDEVKSAYRKLAREYHPDINPDPHAHERMAQINAAFEVLSDPVRRMEYDQTLGHSSNVDTFDESGATRPEAVRIRLTHRLLKHRTPIYGVAYTPRDGTLVSSSFDNEIVWWSLDGEQPERRHRVDGGVVSDIAAVSEDHLVAAGCTEHSLACWTLRKTDVGVWRVVPKDWTCVVKPSPDGQMLAIGNVDASMKVVRAKDGHSRFVVRGHEEAVTALGWSHDSRILASGSADATVRIWCSHTGRELHVFDQVRSTVSSLAFSPDGAWIAVGGVDLSIRVFSLKELRIRKKFFGHERPIESLAFHPRSWLLGSASRDGRLGLWNVAEGVGHGQIEASHQPLNAIAFSPNGRDVAAAGMDKVLRVWRLSMPK